MVKHPDDANPIPQSDIDLLRTLMDRKLTLADDPVNLERRQAWYDFDSAADGARPMILAEVGGCMSSAFPDDVPLECEHPKARNIEFDLRMTFWHFDELKDDHVIEPVSQIISWDISETDFGVAKIDHYAKTADGAMGARKWEHPIQDLDKDFDKLHIRQRSVNREATLARKAFVDELFGDMAPSQLSGGCGWTQGMTWTAIDLIGLENLMLFMYDQPEGLHRLMGLLRDDLIAQAEWMEAKGLLTLNNKDAYTGSGSLGYTHALPQSDFDGEHVRIKDLWALSESQETVGVGPDQFAEFIFPYQKDVIERFGFCYYGCCEPVHTRWHVLKGIENLRRVSISPWCDQEFMAEAMGNRYGFSRKPNPSLISTPKFDEAVIREDVSGTLAITKAYGCPVEVVMKDVHTLGGDPQRLQTWVHIAREEAAKVYG